MVNPPIKPVDVIITTAIKLTKYNLTDKSKFEITGNDFMEQFTLVITVKIILLS
jgi:hypothetical protein